MEVQQDTEQKIPHKTQSLTAHKAEIIEFVGPPGAGKTSNCYCYTALLRHEGFTVLTLQDIKDHFRQINRTKRAQLMGSTLFKHLPKVVTYAFTLFFNRIFSLTAITRYLRIAVFDTVLHQMISNKKYDYVLLEQWMVQELWSATIFRLNAYDRIEKQLYRYYLKTDQLLYFDIDMETASERIANRSSKLSRFDYMDPTQRVRMLNQYNAYLYNLYLQSNCLDKHVISTQNSPQENAQHFLQHLT